MNDKMASNIACFMNRVGDYLHMEYSPKYYKQYTKDKNLAKMFDIISKYYMGGNTVPDTAAYIVRIISNT